MSSFLTCKSQIFFLVFVAFSTFHSTVAYSFDQSAPDTDTDSSPEFDTTPDDQNHELSSVFDSELMFLPRRYGMNEEACPDNQQPQKSKENNIIWCGSNEECQHSYKCVAIPGMKHFGTQINYCCPTKSSVCALPPQPGYGDCGKLSKMKFYFDSTALQCLQFKVLECQGVNENRFDSLDDCRRKCETTACELGEFPLFKNNDMDKPKLCHKNKICPQGYKCRYDKLFRRHVCCGYKNRGACSAGLKPFMVPFTGHARPCKENPIKDECPPDYVCSANQFTGMRYCCSLEYGVCPVGQQAYIHPLTDKTIKCNPISYSGGDCPAGYSCAATVTGSQWGFCCSDAITASCPPETTPFLDSIGKQPQKCTIGVTVCSSGYSCQNSDPIAIVGFCCSLGKPSSLFSGNGRSLYVLEVEEKNRPMAQKPINRPLDLFNIEQWRPELRLVDIQKELDKMDELSAVKKEKPKSVLRKTSQFHRHGTNRATCPPSTAPLLYMGTSLPLSCKMSSNVGCPAPAVCSYAYNDPLHRTLCCIPSDVEDIDEMLGIIPDYTKTPTITSKRPGARPSIIDGEIDNNWRGSRESGEDVDEQVVVVQRPLAVLTSSDPYCPAVIESRICTPGSTDICVEDSFFCQFNIQYQQFMCCSLEPVHF